MKVKLPINISFVLELLHLNKYKAYVVGGAVRSSLLNLPVKDWDICTSAKPEEIKEVFKNFKTIDTGIDHGTVTVLVEGEPIEITTFRLDGEYSDNRRPDSVEFTDDLIKDLSRRDFTMNALAYNEQEGLIDPFGGISSLHFEVIEAVGNPEERFKEDALRMLRAIRFASQLNFTVMWTTMKAIQDNAELINNISKERINMELVKILQSEKPSIGIELLKNSGLLKEILPELQKCVDFDQQNPHHHKNVFDHIMLVLDNTPNDLVLRLSALFHDIGKPDTATIGEDGHLHFYRHHMKSMDIAYDIMKRLKFDNDAIDRVCILVKEHMSRYDNLKPSAIKKFIRRVGTQNLGDLFELQIADIKGSKPPHDFSSVEFIKSECHRILSAKEPISVKDLALNGHDLKALGFKEGKDIGEILKHLLELVIEDPKLNNKEDLIKRVKGGNYETN